MPRSVLAPPADAQGRKGHRLVGLVANLVGDIHQPLNVADNDDIRKGAR